MRGRRRKREQDTGEECLMEKDKRGVRVREQQTQESGIGKERGRRRAARG